MKLFSVSKDGGPDSSVTGYWLIEWKGLFSICLLQFVGSSRDAFHTHAFHAISWVLSGRLEETLLSTGEMIAYEPSLLPIITPRKRAHKVDSVGTSWVLSFRGPWCRNWEEVIELDNKVIKRTLTNNRKVVNETILARV